MRRVHENISESQGKAKNVYRDRVELLRDRVKLLAGKDKVLMTMYLKNGNSCRQMARLAGVNQANIGRRIRKIAQKLIDGEYIRCLQNRKKLTGFEMVVAKDHFLRGLSIKQIAVNRGRSYYGLRKIVKQIRHVIETADEQ